MFMAAAAPAHAQMTAPSTVGTKPKTVSTVPIRPALQTPADTANAMAQAERLAIQSDLAWVGQYNGAITGEVSERMVAAIKEFQKDRGGKQTGVLNPQERSVLAETARVLKPGGLLFFTVPFLWPVHNPPTDQYRFTPFALERHLGKAGFGNIEMQAFGGWDASLAQMIGLWAYRRPMGRIARAIALRVAEPIMRQLMKWDVAPRYPCDDSLMITGISGTARRR